jgi:predicted amidohydrolase YtcJ
MKIPYPILILLFISHFFFACEKKKEEVDTIFYHAKIYTVDSAFSVQEALAIKDEKVVAVGKDEEIEQKYNANQRIDASNQFIYAGLHDAHCHFFGLGQNKQWADLVGAKSFEETVQRLQQFRKDNPNQTWLSGRGWDQNDWEIKEFPTKDLLDEFFPDVPVKLIRIDGHAMLVNQKALDLAGINEKTNIEGGEIRLKFGKPTGVLIDNAMDLIDKVVPELGKDEIKNALLAAEKECFAHGITTVTDAGLPINVIQIINEMQTQNLLKIRMNVMAVPNDYEYWKQNGKLSTPKLKIHGFKIYADGALGSRGACLLEHILMLLKPKAFCFLSPKP